MKRIKALILFLLLFCGTPLLHASGQRQVLNFDLDWHLYIGDLPVQMFEDAESAESIKGSSMVSLPRAFNGEEAFCKSIHELTDTVMWYYKTFKLSQKAIQGKVFIEFEGVRQGADVYVNGQHVGYHENGVMAFGMDLTSYVKKGKNLMFSVKFVFVLVSVLW